MKKYKNSILAIAAGCMVLGILIIFMSFVMAKFDFSKFNTNSSKNNPDIEKIYQVDPSKNINRINVDILDRNVKVIPTDKEVITITYYVNKKEKYEITDAGKTLNFKYIKSRKISDYINFISWNETNNDISIEVPTTYTGDLVLKNSSGNTGVSDINNLSNVDIKSVDGRVELANISATELSIKNSSGKIVVEDTSVSKDINLTNIDGSIQLDGIVASSNLQAKNASGIIKINETTVQKSMTLQAMDSPIELLNVTVKESGIIKNSSGKIDLSNVVVEKDISCKTIDSPIKFTGLTSPMITLNNSSGKIIGDIVGKKSDYKITSSTVDASNNLPKQKDTGNKELNAKTIDASIEIEFSEE